MFVRVCECCVCGARCVFVCVCVCLCMLCALCVLCVLSVVCVCVWLSLKVFAGLRLTWRHMKCPKKTVATNFSGHLVTQCFKKNGGGGGAQILKSKMSKNQG